MLMRTCMHTSTHLTQISAPLLEKNPQGKNWKACIIRPTMPNDHEMGLWMNDRVGKKSKLLSFWDFHRTSSKFLAQTSKLTSVPPGSYAIIVPIVCVQIGSFFSVVSGQHEPYIRIKRGSKTQKRVCNVGKSSSIIPWQTGSGRLQRPCAEHWVVLLPIRLNPSSQCSVHVEP